MMPLGRLERVVHCFESDLQVKPFFANTLQVIEREVGGDVGVVALEFFPAAVDVELGIEVHALTLEARPMVEALARGVVVVPHVPLTDVGRLDTGRLEVLREKTGALGHGALVVDDLVPMHVLAGKNGRPAG